MPSLLVVLPCFNECQSLPPLLHRLSAVRAGLLPAWSLSVLVVDDGSTDGTREIALAGVPDLPLTLIEHLHNEGLGRALASGLKAALSTLRDEDLLAVMDADQTHPPELLRDMLACIEHGSGGPASIDVVIASRYAPGGAEHGLSARRRFLSRLASAVLRWLAHVPGVRDYTCGYRLYRVSALRRADARFAEGLITESGFVCMAELLVKLARSGAHFEELGLDLHYELKDGLSKMNVPATIRRYAALGWRILFDPLMR